VNVNIEDFNATHAVGLIVANSIFDKAGKGNLELV
jgi:hypothetical protein